LRNSTRSKIKKPERRLRRHAMPLTLCELKEKLAENYDETLLLELLEINSSDLVERFLDRIENRYEQLAPEFEDPTEE
jgi:hypothetical protein